MRPSQQERGRGWATRRLLIYLLPGLHLGACMVSMMGYLIPSLQPLGIIWVGIMLVDLPVSAPAYLSAWWNGPFTVLWVVVLGTLWWYFLSRVIARLVDKNRTTGTAAPTTEKKC